MKTWLKNSRKLMAAFGAVAVMLVAGWQFGVGGTEAPFSEKEVALEKAIAGSGSGECTDWVCCQAGIPMTVCYDEEGNPWYGDEKRCGTNSCT